MSDEAQSPSVMTSLASLPIERIFPRGSYASRPPRFANLELLPPSWRAHHEAMFGRAAAVLPDSQLVRLRGATVFDNGAVRLADGRLLQETLPQGAPPAPPRGPAVAWVREPTLLLRKPGDSNYGHWLAELLPRVLDVQSACPGRPLRFAVAAGPRDLRPVRSASLAWLGVGAERLVWLTAEPTVFEDLLVLSGNSIHSHTHDAWGLRRLAAIGRSQAAAGDAAARLYIRRPPDLRRRLLNEPEIRALAADAGFAEVQPETMSLPEQVACFARATHIAGVSGAALANMLWAPAGAAVLVMAPNAGAEYFFWDLANILDHRISLAFGQTGEAARGVHGDFRLDPALFSRWLAEV